MPTHQIISQPAAGTRTYVGFGFGAIQAGLFLYEAFHSGNFGRLVVAEVLPDVVEAVRQADGHFSINIAHADRVETATVGPVEIEDPAQAADRHRLIEAIAEAEEIGTAIPSVAWYAEDGPGSLHRVLAEGLRQKAARPGPQAVVYAAENHNHAAEILAGKVLSEIPADERDAVQNKVRFLNTVIGKMSGVVADPAQKLAPVTPGAERAFLVESFNRILVSKIQFEQLLPVGGGIEGETSPFRRGIEAFEEKDDLLPFEEAKLYGHNATHALAAYIGALCGVGRIADLRDVPGVLPFLRAAFIEESGQALIQKYAGSDPLFTPAGYAHYADDLLARMTNPHLGDTVERVGRDPQRKLGWDDRLIGTMRLALSQGIEPHRYALGAAAAAATLEPSILKNNKPLKTLLVPLWRQASPEKAAQEAVLNLVEAGLHRLTENEFTWPTNAPGAVSSSRVSSS